MAQHYEEAAQVYEKWLSAHPHDPDPTFDLGYTLYLEACAESSPTRARPLRLRARDLFEESRRLGSRWPDLIAFGDSITPEGDDARRYNATPAAEELIRRGETAFSAGRFDEALALYQQALAEDHHAYPAALFTGDVYFNLKNYGKANEWFSKAVGIDPTKETAFRYWGDSLVRQGRLVEARDRYFEAIVAEPYNPLPHEALRNFAAMTHFTVKHPAVKRFVASVELGVDGNPKITLSPDANEPLTIAYAFARAKWLTDDRPKFFSKDSTPRHSLPEEVAALRTAIQIAHELGEKDPAAIAPWKETIATLATLDRAGFLEAYVLFDAADEGIARDYEAYRLQHRELLLRYLRRIWFADDAPDRS